MNIKELNLSLIFCWCILSNGKTPYIKNPIRQIKSRGYNFLLAYLKCSVVILSAPYVLLLCNFIVFSCLLRGHNHSFTLINIPYNKWITTDNIENVILVFLPHKSVVLWLNVKCCGFCIAMTLQGHRTLLFHNTLLIIVPCRCCVDG